MPEEFTYSFTVTPDPVQIQALFDQTHWAAHRQIDDIRRMLENTSTCVTVWQDGRLIGFARIITDGVYRGLLDDVVVDVEFQGRGIGQEMVRQITAQFAHLEELLLGCLDDMVPFYEKLGFMLEAHPHMAIKNKKTPALH